MLPKLAVLTILISCSLSVHGVHIVHAILVVYIILSNSIIHIIGIIHVILIVHDIHIAMTASTLTHTTATNTHIIEISAQLPINA